MKTKYTNRNILLDPVQPDYKLYVKRWKGTGVW